MFSYRETICCGRIFRGRFNEIMVDPRYLKPCRNRLAFCKLGLNKPETEMSDTSSNKLYSDSSSDSGYDESSNQGVTLENAFKKDQVSIGINSQNSKLN